VRLVLVALLVLTGCPTGGGECGYDPDCRGGDVCANTHVCRDPGSLVTLLVGWTINSAPADAASCAAVGDLQVTIRDTEDEDNEATWAPVPCAAGRFSFDKLPVEYDRVSLTVVATGVSQDETIPIGGGTVVFDLAAN